MFPEHLQHAVDCTAPDRSEFALKAITKFVNFGSRGLFPVFISKALCCASLTALSKKKGGVRPIAVGEVLRRLIAKCLVSEAKSEAIELFDSLQLGVGISGGAEAIIHSSKNTYDNIVSAQKDGGVLQIDFQNAFNSVKRSHLLKATYEFIPGIAVFTNFCYSQHTPLFYNNAIIQSESGVQQGDPLGPLLFSLTLWPIIQKIKISVPDLVQHIWYLDDGFIAGSEDQTKQTLEILANEGPERGLILRKDKCELWSIKDLPSIDQAVKRILGNGFEILGAAVGSKEFVASCLKRRVQKNLSMLDNLHHLNDPQCALGILRYCLGTPKLVYSLRTNTPSNEMLEVLKSFDDGQREVLDQIIGSIIDDDAWQQSSLPISLSGLGVRQSQEQYKSAFVGSILASDELVNKITSRRPSESDTFKELQQSLEQFNILSHTQKKIQEALDKEKLADLIRNQSSTREKARLQSLCLPHSGAWLAAPPIPALGLHLPAKEFQVSVKYRLGIAVYDQERKCPYCKSGTLDTFGDHAVACHGRGDAISRHDRIRDRIASACSAANLSPIIEKRNLIAENNSRPGDVYLPCWKSGQSAALDITVTSSLQPNIISHASEKSGYAIEAAEDRKYAQYENSCAQQGIMFVPLAIEVLGGLSRTLKKALLRMSLLADSRNYQSVGQSIAFDRAVQSLSVVIIRGSANMLLSRAP
ncbi:uncharacterized protein LOC142351636 [Convolutriloba macropyga]|uniref:uncharacterized protein LOC142351636 n=1 Tax=Convolutriloba macropyga TaxID=536237 RepID=UPI003F5207D4